MADQDILAFIAEESGKGTPEDEIRKSAAARGWSAEDVNGAFASFRLRSDPLRATREAFVVSRPDSRPVDTSFLIALVFIGAFGFLVYRYAPTLANSAQLALSDIVGTTTPLTNEPFVPFAAEPNTYGSNSISHSTESHTAKVVSVTGATAAQPVATPTPLPAGIPHTVPSPVAPPSVTVGADATVIQPNAPVTISWSSTNATACQSNGTFVTNDATSGVVVAHPLLSTSFTIACVGPGGHVQASIYVRTAGTPINTTPPSPAPTPDPTGGPPAPPDIPPPPPPSDTPPSPPSPTPPPSPPAPPSIPVGTYAVYPSCEAPPTSGYAYTVYIDPANGSDTGDGSQVHPYKTLATVLAQKKLNTNTHAILLPGDHGKVFADGVHGNTALAGGSGWVWLDFRSGAYAEYFDIRSLHEWLITNATLTDPADVNHYLASFAYDTNFIIADSYLYTAQDSSSWGVSQWLAADNAISSDTSTCVAILRNTAKNIRFGIMIGTRTNSPDPAQNSVKVLAEDNLIKNFSGDGMRPIGSDITFYHNAIYDEYVSVADGDANHDDGIQGYALNGAEYQNVTIDHNWVEQTTSTSRPYNAILQGISSFDGVYTNVRVTNNVVISGAYHGISWYGDQNTLIDHNTVLNPYTPTTVVLKIYAPNGKSGNPPVNVTVSNNLTPWVGGATTGVTFVNNITWGNTSPVPVFTTVSPIDGVFDLRPKAGGIADGKGAGSDMYAPVLAVNGRGIVGTIAETPAPVRSAAIAAAPPRAPSKLVAAADATGQAAGDFILRIWEWIVSLFRSVMHAL